MNLVIKLKTMSKLQNNFTTPEQSKRWLEFGLSADSADCYYDNNNNPNIIPQKYFESFEEFANYHVNVLGHGICIPCWSVGRLVEIWELCTSIKFERWTHNGVYMPLLDDCIAHIRFALNPDTTIYFDFSKLEE